MNWRRGVLFALIHGLIVLAFIVKEESRDWPRASIEPYTKESLQHIAWQEGQFSFDPCNGGYVDGVSAAEMVVAAANLPVMVLTRWPNACPERTLAAKFAQSTLHTRGRNAASAVHVIVETLVIVEWLLIGGFPLARRSRLWQEPGAFITICTVIGFFLAMVSPLTPLAHPACLGAFAGWLWWFGALLLKGVRAIRAYHIARA